MIGDARPLDDTRALKLVQNTSTLVQEVEHRSGLLTEMIAAGYISQRQKEFIECGATPGEINRRLIEVMRRSTVSDFDGFIKCLAATGQQHLASLLLTDGGEFHK